MVSARGQGNDEAGQGMMAAGVWEHHRGRPQEERPFIMAVKRFVPAAARRAVIEMLGIGALREATARMEERIRTQELRISQLEERLDRSGHDAEFLWETSRKRWKGADPDRGLTWGRAVSGEAFIDKVVEHGGFEGLPTVLELGPGYGRLPRAIQAKAIGFSQYLGIDISETNVKYLRQEFPSDKMQFIRADAETCSLDITFDTFIASLVMKHLFPTFEACLGNLARFANPGSRFFFDLLEGDRQFFEDDGVTFIHHYTREGVQGILRKVGLDLAVYDLVEHDPEHVRLLVVAQKRLDPAHPRVPHSL